MAYIGRDIEYGALTKQTLTANSSTTVFALDQSVFDANSLLVSVGGVIQEPDEAYTASGTVLTFSEAPTTGDPIWIVYLGKTLGTSTSRGAITYQAATGNGSVTTVAMTSSGNTGNIVVTLNGVVQTPSTDFSVAGSTLTFTTAPFNGAAIGIHYLGKQARLGVPSSGSIVQADLANSGTLPAWNGSALTGIAGMTKADVFELQNNIALLNFLRANDITAKRTSMLNGFQDQFRTEDGIVPFNGDVAVYGTDISPTGSGSWNGATSSFSYSGGTVDPTAQNSAIRLTENIEGDFYIEMTMDKPIYASGGRHHWGIYDVSFDGSFNQSAQAGGMVWGGVNESWSYDNIDGLKYDASTVFARASFSPQPTDSTVMKIERIGNVIKFYISDTLQHTWTQTDAADMRLVLGIGGPLTANQGGWNNIKVFKNTQTLTTPATLGTGSSQLTYSNNTYTNKSATHDLSIMTKGTNDLSEVSSPSSAPSKGHIEALVDDRIMSISDSSSSSHGINQIGNVALSTTTKKIGTSSIYFTGGKLEIPSSTDFDFAGDFTIEYWINSTDTGTTSSSTNSRVMSRGDHPDEWFIRADSSSGVEAMKLQFGGTDDLNLHTGGTADTWADGTWHHFAVTRDGNTVRLYIDGTQIDTTTVSGAFDAGDGANLYIGNEDDDSEDFHGYLDEIRISNNCRYPSGTSFAPSTTAFTSDSNTKLLIHGDETYTTPNTDIIGEMSRDGGTTWSPATLRRVDKVIAGSNYDVLMGDVDFTGDPSGTNIKGRIKTANQTQVTVKGMAVNWQ